MQTLTVTNLRSNLFRIIKETIKGHQQIKITSKEGNAVLISEEDYESILETAELLSIKGFKETILKADQEIEDNKLYSMEEAFNE